MHNSVDLFSLLTDTTVYVSARRLKPRDVPDGQFVPPGPARIPAFFKDKEDSIRHFAAETLGSTGDEAGSSPRHGTSILSSYSHHHIIDQPTIPRGSNLMAFQAAAAVCAEQLTPTSPATVKSAALLAGWILDEH